MIKFVKFLQFFSLLALTLPAIAQTVDSPKHQAEGSYSEQPIISEVLKSLHEYGIRAPLCTGGIQDVICSLSANKDEVANFIDRLAPKDKLEGYYYTNFEQNELSIYAVNPKAHSFVCCEIQSPFEQYQISNGRTVLFAKFAIPAEIFLQISLVEDPPFLGQEFISKELSLPQRVAISALTEEQDKVVAQQVSVENFDREILIYRSYQDQVPDTVIYAVDGQDVQIFASALEGIFSSLEVKLPNLAIIGVPSGDNNTRKSEYLKTATEGGKGYNEFNAIFLNYIAPRTEGILGFDGTPENRILFGRSNGGNWALNFLIDHPDFANRTISLSPGGEVPDNLNFPNSSAKELYIGQGAFEGSFGEKAESIAEYLDENGLNVRYYITNSGHSYLSWIPLFLEIIMEIESVNWKD